MAKIDLGIEQDLYDFALDIGINTSFSIVHTLSVKRTKGIINDQLC